MNVKSQKGQAFLFFWMNLAFIVILVISSSTDFYTQLIFIITADFYNKSF